MSELAENFPSQLALVLATWSAPIVAVFISMWFSRRRHAIRWVVLTPTSMMVVAEEIIDKLQVTFSGTAVRNLIKYSFILHNSGREPIDQQAIVESLRWTGPGTILDARVVATNPPVDLDIHVEKQTMVLAWRLFNQGCQALIEVICESETETETGSITGQIKGVPEIHTKNIRNIDENRLRKRYRTNLLHVPRVLRYLSSEALTVFGIRYQSEIVGIYCTIPLGMLAFMAGDSLLGWPTVYSAALGFGFSASCSVLLLYILRNPYARLLRMQRRVTRTG